MRFPWGFRDDGEEVVFRGVKVLRDLSGRRRESSKGFHHREKKMSSVVD